MMARPPRPHFPGAIFHVMARGNAGQSIFVARREWETFLSSLERVKEQNPFELHAYCLMSNHIHLLVRVFDSPVWTIMHQLLTIWARRFNFTRDRIGHVFQGRYRSILCRDELYFKQVLRYIHLNPVKSGLARSAGDWEWSGHREYLGGGSRVLIDKALPLSLFDPDPLVAARLYAEFVSEGIEKPEVAELPDEPGGLRGAALPEAPHDRPNRPSLEGLAAQVCAEEGLSVSALRERCRSRWTCQVRRRFAMKAFAEGWGVRTIASYLGIAPSGVSRTIARERTKRTKGNA